MDVLAHHRHNGEILNRLGEIMARPDIAIGDMSENEHLLNLCLANAGIFMGAPLVIVSRSGNRA